MDTAPRSPSRRHFLRGALALPVAAALRPAAGFAEPAGATAPAPLPRRKLGNTGADVTMVSIGGMMAALSPDYLDIAWSMGIRSFDTADCYMKGRSEKIIAEWLAKYPERRKEVFLVTKDHPKKGPDQLLEMIDRRLEALGTKYVDAFYIHGIGPREYGEGSREWPKSAELRRVFDKLRSSGKCKSVGFSCHDGAIVDYLNAAAEGGFTDVIMLKYTPFFTKGDAFDQAVQRCFDKGVGLIAMKTMRNAGDVPKRLPEFDKLGLTTPQALLQAVWSDPRMSAICSMIENVEQMEENTAAARKYKAPLQVAEIELLRETVVAHRRTYCPGCPSCNALASASGFAFDDIARFVTYYEQDGLAEARDLYRTLPAAARDAGGIDLAALRDGCAFHTDYPEIVRRAERYFA